jgi:hypothetical protein
VGSRVCVGHSARGRLSCGAAPVPREPPARLSAGVQEREAACAVELEEVVDRALQAPLGAGGWFAADQHSPAVLDGVDVAEQRLDDRLRVRRQLRLMALLGSELSV